MTVLMKRASSNQGRLLPHVEGEPNFYEIDKHFKLPSLGMQPWQSQYPPPRIAAGAGNAFPPEQRSGPNEFPPYPPGTYQPGTYPPPPPLYGHLSNPHAMSAYPSNTGYSPYPHYYRMPYGPPPAEQYPHYPHRLGPWYGAQSHHDDVPPNSAGQAKTEDAPSAPVPPYYHMQYGLPPPEPLYPHYSHPLGPRYDAQSQYVNFPPPPSSAESINSEEIVPSPTPQDTVSVQRNTHYSHPLGPRYGAQSQYVNFPPPPSSADPMNSEEIVPSPTAQDTFAVKRKNHEDDQRKEDF